MEQGRHRARDRIHPFRKYFEELEIGETLITHRRTVTESDVVNFAGISGDFFYAHMDDIAARESLFEKRVAHGYFVLSAAAGLFVDPAPGPVLANYGLEGLRFVKPVYIGDTIQARLTCKQKTAKEDREGQIPQGVVHWDVEVTNQHGEPVAVYTILTLVFLEGAATIGITSATVPDLSEVNARLAERTGWAAVPVSGFLPAKEFFACLAERRFPTTVSVRPMAQLDYLPEPDIFHDVFGHVPLHAHPVFADFLQRFGQAATRAVTEEQVEAMARLFWFTVEFGLVQEDGRVKVYGSGLISSHGDAANALSATVRSSPLLARRRPCAALRDRPPAGRAVRRGGLRAALRGGGRGRFAAESQLVRFVARSILTKCFSRHPLEVPCCLACSLPPCWSPRSPLPLRPNPSRPLPPSGTSTRVIRA